MTVKPRHVVCVLHPRELSLDDVCSRFPGFALDREYSRSEPDSRMENSFRVCADRVTPSITMDDWAAIRAHTAVSYILSPPLDATASIDVAGQALALVASAFEAGALAVKGESAGIAHGKARWLQLQARAQESLESNLIRAWVRYPIGANEVLYSVGMQLLGAPDVEVERGELTEPQLVDALSIFMHYLLIDRPADLATGHTFREAPDKPRFRLSRVECTRYEADDFKFNPYGYWRLAQIDA